MPLALYTATAAALLALVHRFVRPVRPRIAAIVFLLPFCFTGFALVTGRVYAPVDLAYGTEPLLSMKSSYGIGQAHAEILSDIASQMIPWRKAVQMSLAHHEWPLWNPYILSGDVLAAAAQPAAYSPFTLIACLLPVATSFTFSAAIAFFIAALGAYLFARELGCSDIAALIGAAAFMYSTNVAFFVLWPLGSAWTFLPFVLLGTRRVVRRSSIRSAALLGTALCLMLLAGHPETALHVVFTGALYAAFELAFHRRNALRGVLAGVGAGIVALLVCAVYLLPVLEAIPQSEQNAWRMEFYAQQPHGTTTANLAARLATDFFPFLYMAHWNNRAVDDLGADSTSVGSIAFALAILAVWRVRSHETWFFAALAIFGLLARIGWRPVAIALQKLPLFDVAVNDRLSFAAAFALAMLAAIGIDRLSDRSAAITALLILVAISAGTIAIVRAHWVSEVTRTFSNYATFAEIAGLGCATALLMTKRSWTAFAILALVVVQRMLTVGDIYTSFPSRAAYPPVPIFARLPTIGEPFRVTALGIAMIPNQSAMYGLEDVRGYEALTLNRYVATWRLWCTPQPVSFNRVDDLTRPFLNFLNVRFAIVPEKFAIPPGWRVFATQRGSMLLENTNVIPRAFVPLRVGFYNAGWEAVNAMTSQTDFRARVWIQSPTAANERDNGPGRVTIAPRRYGFTMSANMERDGWLAVSEPAWKGWRAYVDGKRVSLDLANCAFLGIHVPQGHHDVKLLYKPQSFVAGRAVTIATLLAIAIVCIVASVHHHRLRLE